MAGHLGFRRIHLLEDERWRSMQGKSVYMYGNEPVNYFGAYVIESLSIPVRTFLNSR